MMLAGELDAVIHYIVHNNLVDRSQRRSREPSGFQISCFRTRSRKASAIYRKTGLLPINHQAVVRRDIAEKEPWVALNLLKAFIRANDIANAERVAHVRISL